MKKFLAFCLVLLLALSVSGCSQEETPPPTADNTLPELKIGWIYIGVPGDAGYTYAHDEGRKYMEEGLKDRANITSVILESVPEGADSLRSIQQLAEEGCQVIFANSFGYGDSMVEAAKQYPDIKFLHCSGLTTGENLSTYFGRMYQARYLSGMVAGAMTTSNNIGYVAAFPTGEVVRGINAFTLGAQATNPDVTVQVVWTNTWFDPAVEGAAADSLLQSGCDVIAQHQDTPAPQQAAENAGAFSIGYNSDMSSFAPNANLTSAVWSWGPYYQATIEKVLDGTWTSEAYWGGMSDGIVGLSMISDQVPEEVRQQIAAKQEELVMETWDVFTGPLTDQNGEERYAANEGMSDEGMLAFDWFVQGVQGTISQ